MKWIKVDVPEFKEQSYVDTDKAFRFHIKPIKVKSEIMYRVRAYFLVGQNANKDKTYYPLFVELAEFKKKEEAEDFIEKLLDSFLEKRGK